MGTQAVRNRYVTDSVGTASPAQLLLMLFDRLCRDLEDGEHALITRNTEAAHNALTHGQRIVAELADSLDTTAWPEGKGLSDLYQYLERKLVAANITKDPLVVAECRRLVIPLRDTWREAAVKAHS
jgi:flagellar protein FliS